MGKEGVKGDNFCKITICSEKFMWSKKLDEKIIKMFFFLALFEFFYNSKRYKNDYLSAKMFPILVSYLLIICHIYKLPDLQRKNNLGIFSKMRDVKS